MMEVIRHQLSVAVRVDDYFLGTPVPDELVVRIGRDTAQRHADGTYRFIDLAPGKKQVVVESPDERWLLLDAPPEVVLPTWAHTALPINAWPAPIQRSPLGITSLRCKLEGTPAATIARELRVDINGIPTGRRTVSSTTGELLFLLPGHVDLDTHGLIPITLHVVGLSITGGVVVDGDARSSFTGASLRIVPNRETRLRIQVT